MFHKANQKLKMQIDLCLIIQLKNFWEISKDALQDIYKHMKSRNCTHEFLESEQLYCRQQ